ncbi:MAG TPA: Asp-tRNA(Asn)/Glu-tRNA(Gln) amidotransferase subunit GatC [Blastocatellia bacterium]|nr:Asp-tRNA(Asn)/Glu-tRNA(Gln) amidotransferase subunit GatC [Blastocatellia bacterium]
MPTLTREEVQKIGELARLKLTAEETESFTAQLGAILDYVRKLDEVDTSAVEPMSHCSFLAGESGESLNAQTLRDDVTQPCLGQKAAIENAPDAASGYFRVPKVIGG